MNRTDKHTLFHRPERGAKPIAQGDFETYAQAVDTAQQTLPRATWWVDSRRWCPVIRRWSEICPEPVASRLGQTGGGLSREPAIVKHLNARTMAAS